MGNSITIVDFTVASQYFEFASSGLDWLITAFKKHMSADPIKIGYLNKVVPEFGASF
jgi:hypothetical protein